MPRIQTRIPILKNRRAVYVLSVGIVFALLSLVGGWLFTLPPAYMNYAPQTRRDRMPIQDLGDNLVAEVPGSFRRVPDQEGRFQTPWGEQIHLWTVSADASDLHDPSRRGRFNLTRWRERIASGEEGVTCRHVRHPLGFGAEVLVRTESLYIHELAIVEGTDQRGDLPEGRRVIRMRMEVPVNRYPSFRPLLLQVISTLAHKEPDGE